MKNKDLIMFGMIIGIALFFLGAMISNVFPSDESDLLAYKVAAFFKLMGIGILVATLVVGGIIVEKIDRNLKMLLLILGLVLLIVYTIGSPWLSWNISSLSPSGMVGSDPDEEYYEEAYEERPTALATPGFEAVILIAAIGLFLIAKRKRIRR